MNGSADDRPNEDSCLTGLPIKAISSVVAMLAACSAMAAGFGPLIPQGPVKQDLTGTWVSIISEDWIYRMITPPKETTFNQNGLPLNQRGKDEALKWDPQRDAAEGAFCKAYGVGAIMRLPARLRITEPTADTLRIEIDAGSQVRTIHFGSDTGEHHAPTLQGYSVGAWPIGPQRPPAQRPASGAGAGAPPAPVPGAGVFGPVASAGNPGALRIDTRDMTAGYLRKNGVPYSAQATITEYMDRIDHDDGTSWLILTTIIEDPEYLLSPYVTSSHFRKEPDDSKWRPTPCEIVLPL